MELVKPNNSILRKVCKNVIKVDSEILKLMDELTNLCLTHENPKLLALSAPQVGIDKRVSVIVDADKIYKLANPIITYSDGRERFFEACGSVEMSTGCVGGFVDRAAYVEVKALDENGKECMIKADGVLAVVLQHEIDHLDGILYTDKLVGDLEHFDSYEERLNYRKRNPLKILEKSTKVL